MRGDAYEPALGSRDGRRRLRRLARLQGSRQSWLHPRCLRQSLDGTRELRALGTLGSGRHPRLRHSTRRHPSPTRYRPCFTSPRAPTWANRSPIRRNITTTTSPGRSLCSGRCWTPTSSPSCSLAHAPSTASLEQIPIARRCPKQPVNPYGASKLMIERVLL